MRRVVSVFAAACVLAACTPSVNLDTPDVNVPINLRGGERERPAQAENPSSQAASSGATTQNAAQATPQTADQTTAQTNQANTSPVAAGAAGSLDTSVTLLPGNAFPFEDGFENFSLGQVVPIAAPQNYGIYRSDGSDDPTFAKAEETTDASNQAGKAVQLNAIHCCANETGYLTLGSNTSQDYRATFDFKINGDDSRTALKLLVNLGAGANYYYRVNVLARQGAVSMDKVLGDQSVQLVNRDGLGFNYTDGLYHQAEITSRGGVVSVSVDGRTLVEYSDTDPNYQQGGLGIGIDRESAFIDNLRVTPL